MAETLIPGVGAFQENATAAEYLIPGAGSVSAASTSAGGVDALTADDLQSLSQLSTPALSQIHALAADDLQSVSELTTPTVSQTNILLADDLQSTSELTTPSVGQSNILLADDLESSTELKNPQLVSCLSETIDDPDFNNADSWEKYLVFSDKPVISGGVATFTNAPGGNYSDVKEVDGYLYLSGETYRWEIVVDSCTQETGTYARFYFGARQLWTDADGAGTFSGLNTPAGDVNIRIETANTSGASTQTVVISRLSIIKTCAHDLTADDLQSLSQISTPALTEVSAGTDVLLADDLESASELSTPSISQIQVLLADDLESATELSSPTLGNSLLADDIESASELSTPAIGQVHAILASDVESAAEISIPALSQIHALNASDIESTSELSTPAIGTFVPGVDTLYATSIQSVAELLTPVLNRVTGAPILFRMEISGAKSMTLSGVKRASIG